MNKKFIIIPALLVAIGGGAVLAQTDYFEAAINNPKISASEAKNIALKQFDGKIVEFDFEGDELFPHYEIDVVKDNEKVEITIDAQSGQATISSREIIKKPITQAVSELPKSNTNHASTNKIQSGSNGQTIITQDQAISIAQSKAEGTVTSVELDIEHNIKVYEIEIRNGQTEYDFEIDATTGDILKYEEDLED